MRAPSPRSATGQWFPGNANLSPADRQARIDQVARPYHDRIAEELDARAARGQRTVLVSLHSFTPSMGGVDRPWHYCVLHEGSSPFSDAMLARFRAQFPDHLVGDNEPYAMDGTDFTVPFHAIGRGLDYLELEIRQDLLADAAGEQAAAALLARLLPSALGDI
jgi:predicted N-formylglutamate amidohydrolase